MRLRFGITVLSPETETSRLELSYHLPEEPHMAEFEHAIRMFLCQILIRKQ